MRLAARPADLGKSFGIPVEEVMLVNPTVTLVTGEAVEDLEVHGLRLKAGTIVQVLFRSTGTDPASVEESAVDGRRASEGRPHRGFGGGVHYCLGHFVARKDMAVPVPLLARKMPRAEADGRGLWLPVSGDTGAIRFPLRFQPPGRPVLRADRCRLREGPPAATA